MDSSTAVRRFACLRCRLQAEPVRTLRSGTKRVNTQQPQPTRAAKNSKRRGRPKPGSDAGVMREDSNPPSLHGKHAAVQSPAISNVNSPTFFTGIQTRACGVREAARRALFLVPSRMFLVCRLGAVGNCPTGTERGALTCTGRVYHGLKGR